ncbi:MAG: hypothetical protein ABIH23_10620 [bacterium]
MNSSIDEVEYSSAKYWAFAPGFLGISAVLFYPDELLAFLAIPMEMITATLLIWRWRKVGRMLNASILALLAGIILSYLTSIYMAGDRSFMNVFLGLAAALPLIIIRFTIRKGMTWGRLFRGLLFGVLLPLGLIVGFLGGRNDWPYILLFLAISAVPFCALARWNAWSQAVATGDLFKPPEQLARELEERRHRKPFRWRRSYTVALAASPFLLLIGIHIGVRIYLNHKIVERLAPEEYSELQKLFASFDKPVDCPPEWFKKRTYSEEVESKAEEISELFTRLKVWEVRDRKYNTELEIKGDLSEKEWTQLHEDLQPLEPYFDALISLSQHPDYDLLFSTDDSSQVFPAANFGAKMLCLQAYASAKDGNWEKALAANLAVHRLAKRQAPSRSIVHIAADRFRAEASDGTMFLALKCDDVPQLRESLAELNRLDPLVNLQVLNRWFLLNTIGQLRESEWGSQFLIPGKTLAYYRDHGTESIMRETDWRQPRNDSARWHMDLYKAGCLVGLRRTIEKYYHSTGIPGMRNMPVREACAIAKYHLAQLTLAYRLSQLENGMALAHTTDLVPADLPTETGAAPIRPADFVPTYLPTEPLDPFAEGKTDRSYQFDAKRKVFYSIGPDGIDDGNEIPYIQQNGIESRGDIAPFVEE